MSNYVSLDRLTYFWGKVKTYIANAISTATSELTTQLNEKAPKDSPALTGTPTAPTAAADTNTDQIATTKFVKSAIAAIPPTDLSEYFNDVAYDSESKNIQFKHGSAVVKTLNAAPFIKDGMVDTVTISDGTGSNLNKKVLKITFNTDSGKEAIELPLDGIFNANNYYDKTATDGKFATKEELGGYVKNTDLVEATEAEIDAMFN